MLAGFLAHNAPAVSIVPVRPDERVVSVGRQSQAAFISANDSGAPGPVAAFSKAGLEVQLTCFEQTPSFSEATSRAMCSLGCLMTTALLVVTPLTLPISEFDSCRKQMKHCFDTIFDHEGSLEPKAKNTYPHPPNPQCAVKFMMRARIINFTEDRIHLSVGSYT